MIYGSYSRQLKAQSIREPKSASKLLNWKVENSLTLVSEIFFEGCLPLKPNHSNAPRQTCCAVLAPRGAQKHLDVVQSSTSGKCAKGGNYQCFACCPSTSSPNYRNDTVPLLPLPEFDALHSGDIAGIEYYPIKREQMPACRILAQARQHRGLSYAGALDFSSASSPFLCGTVCTRLCALLASRPLPKQEY